jgi:hypothetical protein
MVFRKWTSENGLPKNGLPKMDFRKWTSENGLPKNGLPKMDFRKWTSENGLPKMDFRKWTFEIFHRILLIASGSLPWFDEYIY